MIKFEKNYKKKTIIFIPTLLTTLSVIFLLSVNDLTKNFFSSVDEYLDYKSFEEYDPEYTPPRSDTYSYSWGGGLLTFNITGLTTGYLTYTDGELPVNTDSTIKGEIIYDEFNYGTVEVSDSNTNNTIRVNNLSGPTVAFPFVPNSTIYPSTGVGDYNEKTVTLVDDQNSMEFTVDKEYYTGSGLTSEEPFRFYTNSSYGYDAIFKFYGPNSPFDKHNNWYFYEDAGQWTDYRDVNALLDLGPNPTDSGNVPATDTDLRVSSENSRGFTPGVTYEGLFTSSRDFSDGTLDDIEATWTTFTVPLYHPSITDDVINQIDDGTYDGEIYQDSSNLSIFVDDTRILVNDLIYYIEESYFIFIDPLNFEIEGVSVIPIVIPISSTSENYVPGYNGYAISFELPSSFYGKTINSIDFRFKSIDVSGYKEVSVSFSEEFTNSPSSVPEGIRLDSSNQIIIPSAPYTDDFSKASNYSVSFSNVSGNSATILIDYSSTNDDPNANDDLAYLKLVNSLDGEELFYYPEYTSWVDDNSGLISVDISELVFSNSYEIYLGYYTDYAHNESNITEFNTGEVLNLTKKLSPNPSQSKNNVFVDVTDYYVNLDAYDADDNKAGGVTVEINSEFSDSEIDYVSFYNDSSNTWSNKLDSVVTQDINNSSLYHVEWKSFPYNTNSTKVRVYYDGYSDPIEYNLDDLNHIGDSIFYGSQDFIWTINPNFNVSYDFISEDSALIEIHYPDYDGVNNGAKPQVVTLTSKSDSSQVTYNSLDSEWIQEDSNSTSIFATNLKRGHEYSVEISYNPTWDLDSSTFSVMSANDLILVKEYGSFSGISVVSSDYNNVILVLDGLNVGSFGFNLQYKITYINSAPTGNPWTDVSIDSNVIFDINTGEVSFYNLIEGTLYDVSFRVLYDDNTYSSITEYSFSTLTAPEISLVSLDNSLYKDGTYNTTDNSSITDPDDKDAGFLLFDYNIINPSGIDYEIEYRVKNLDNGLDTWSSWLVASGLDTVNQKFYISEDDTRTANSDGNGAGKLDIGTNYLVEFRIKGSLISYSALPSVRTSANLYLEESSEASNELFEQIVLLDFSNASLKTVYKDSGSRLAYQLTNLVLTIDPKYYDVNFTNIGFGGHSEDLSGNTYNDFYMDYYMGLNYSMSSTDRNVFTINFNDIDPDSNGSYAKVYKTISVRWDYQKNSIGSNSYPRAWFSDLYDSGKILYDDGSSISSENLLYIYPESWFNNIIDSDFSIDVTNITNSSAEINVSSSNASVSSYSIIRKINISSPTYNYEYENENVNLLGGESNYNEFSETLNNLVIGNSYNITVTYAKSAAIGGINEINGTVSETFSTTGYLTSNSNDAKSEISISNYNANLVMSDIENEIKIEGFSILLSPFYTTTKLKSLQIEDSIGNVTTIFNETELNSFYNSSTGLYLFDIDQNLNYSTEYVAILIEYNYDEVNTNVLRYDFNSGDISGIDSNIVTLKNDPAQTSDFSVSVTNITSTSSEIEINYTYDKFSSPYVIKISLIGGSSVINIFNGDFNWIESSGKIEINVFNLEPDTNYDIEISFRDNYGTETTSPTINRFIASSFSTLENYASFNSVVIEQSSITTNSATVILTDFNEGTTVGEYSVWYNLSSSSGTSPNYEVTSLDTTASEIATFELINLNPNTSYSINVWLEFYDGSTSSTIKATFNTKSEKSVSSVYLTSNSSSPNNSINVDASIYDPSTGLITSNNAVEYRVTTLVNGIETVVVDWSDDPQSTGNFVISGLDKNTEYYVYVRVPVLLGNGLNASHTTSAYLSSDTPFSDGDFDTDLSPVPGSSVTFDQSLVFLEINGSRNNEQAKIGGISIILNNGNVDSMPTEIYLIESDGSNRYRGTITNDPLIENKYNLEIDSIPVNSDSKYFSGIEIVWNNGPYPVNSNDFLVFSSLESISDDNYSLRNYNNNLYIPSKTNVGPYKGQIQNKKSENNSVSFSFSSQFNVYNYFVNGVELVDTSSGAVVWYDYFDDPSSEFYHDDNWIDFPISRNYEIHATGLNPGKTYSVYIYVGNTWSSSINDSTRIHPDGNSYDGWKINTSSTLSSDSDIAKSYVSLDESNTAVKMYDTVSPNTNTLSVFSLNISNSITNSTLNSAEIVYTNSSSGTSTLIGNLTENTSTISDTNDYYLSFENIPYDSVITELRVYYDGNPDPIVYDISYITGPSTVGSTSGFSITSISYLNQLIEGSDIILEIIVPYNYLSNSISNPEQISSLRIVDSLGNVVSNILYNPLRLYGTEFNFNYITNSLESVFTISSSDWNSKETYTLEAKVTNSYEGNWTGTNGEWTGGLTSWVQIDTFELDESYSSFTGLSTITPNSEKTLNIKLDDFIEGTHSYTVQYSINGSSFMTVNSFDPSTGEILITEIPPFNIGDSTLPLESGINYQIIIKFVYDEPDVDVNNPNYIYSIFQYTWDSTFSFSNVSSESESKSISVEFIDYKQGTATGLNVEWYLSENSSYIPDDSDYKKGIQIDPFTSTMYFDRDIDGNGLEPFTDYDIYIKFSYDNDPIIEDSILDVNSYTRIEKLTVKTDELSSAWVSNVEMIYSTSDSLLFTLLVENNDNLFYSIEYRTTEYMSIDSSDLNTSTTTSWNLASDSSGNEIINSSSKIQTVLIDNLKPNTKYKIEFKVISKTSENGTTKEEVTTENNSFSTSNQLIVFDENNPYVVSVTSSSISVSLNFDSFYTPTVDWKISYSITNSLSGVKEENIIFSDSSGNHLFNQDEFIIDEILGNKLESNVTYVISFNLIYFDKINSNLLIGYSDAYNFSITTESLPEIVNIEYKQEDITSNEISFTYIVDDPNPSTPYLIEYSYDNGMTWHISTGSYITITGLNSNTLYNIFLRVENEPSTTAAISISTLYNNPGEINSSDLSDWSINWTSPKITQDSETGTSSIENIFVTWNRNIDSLITSVHIKDSDGNIYNGEVVSDINGPHDYIVSFYNLPSNTHFVSIYFGYTVNSQGEIEYSDELDLTKLVNIDSDTSKIFYVYHTDSYNYLNNDKDSINNIVKSINYLGITNNISEGWSAYHWEINVNGLQDSFLTEIQIIDNRGNSMSATLNLDTSSHNAGDQIIIDDSMTTSSGWITYDENKYIVYFNTDFIDTDFNISDNLEFNFTIQSYNNNTGEFKNDSVFINEYLVSDENISITVNETTSNSVSLIFYSSFIIDKDINSIVSISFNSSEGLVKFVPDGSVNTVNDIQLTYDWTYLSNNEVSLVVSGLPSEFAIDLGKFSVEYIVGYYTESDLDVFYTKNTSSPISNSIVYTQVEILEFEQLSEIEDWKIILIVLGSIFVVSILGYLMYNWINNNSDDGKKQLKRFNKNLKNIGKSK